MQAGETAVRHWHTHIHIMHQMCQRIGAVRKWPVARGYRGNNPAGDATSAALPKTGTMRQHHRPLPFAELGAALGKDRGER